MKNITYLFVIGFIISACSSDAGNVHSNPQAAKAGVEFSLDRNTPEIKDYWFNGKAEICSYALRQARYGEIRTGEAVTVFVAEPFSKISMTKADRRDDQTSTVMKLNFQKRFNTGIYPYNLMTSTFFPIDSGSNSVKATHSMQEWCGHVFMEWQNDDRPQLDIRSYFQGENTQILPKTSRLEDDFWTKIRLNPEAIEMGKYIVFPSFAYLRFSHKAPKGYLCEVSRKNGGATSILSLNYSALGRTLNITYESAFPHTILSWKETYTSGWGAKAKTLTSEGKLMKKMMSAYWEQHDNVHEVLRDSLGLKL